MKAVILAGGRGTRLAPYTTVFPKPMLPIGGKPVLEIIISQLAYYGFKDIVISLGYLSELIQLYFKNKKVLPKGVRLSFILEKKPLGTAGPVSLLPDMKESFLVMNGDVLTTLDFGQLFRFHQRKKAMLTVGVHRKDVKMELGIVKLAKNCEVEDYIEKPTYTFYDSMGIYVYHPSVLKYIRPDTRLDLPELVLKLIRNKEKVFGYYHKKQHYWIDMGRPQEYQTANEKFLKQKNEFLRK
ncbi:MAG: sugar phosphate nucleotidyltransferase [bacterium]|nr:sugar phosphate nucleotidyltransferase [bacterium]